ncbi:MAG: ribonuclease R, partial [Gammaproteobacteria bacterium]|nr:ribonuclease R [Gammaproteobacteria bacterium]
PEQVVIVRINIRPTYRSKAVGTVVQVLGDYLAPGMEIQIAIAQYGIRQHWSDDIYDQLKQLPLEVEESECQGRKDLRELPLITIDGEDARDFDDAVYCQPNDKGWQLWVAIADVSHYVTEDSPLDIEAKQRGTSVYFPESVIPMLPEQVSNGLCSLKPHVDRLCMVCEMQLDKTGKVTSSQFYPAVMHSKARMTYTKVWAILQGDEVLRSEYQTLVEPIENLHSIYKLRDKLRQQRGAIDFDTTETQFIFNENKKIETIVPVHRNDAHKLIEECMICTNVAAAEYLVKHKAPGLFRVHMGPQDSKLEKFRSFIAELGLFITGGDAPEPAVFQKLLNEVKDRPDFENIQIMLLRSMSQAEYTPENQGHFGLAFEAYSHFTSPIRRYPDLIVHRIIKSIITGANKDKSYPYNNQVLSQIGQSSSHSERNADLATRDVSDWLKCEYMQAHIGKAYLGTVSGVTNFGVFVRLDTVFVEGLIHVTELGNDYYHFDAGKQRLIGERNRQSFGIGDQLEIEVVDVDIEQRRIDFSLRAVISSKGKPVKKMSEREKLYEQAKKKVARDKLKETGKKPKKSGKRSKAVSSSKKSKKTRKKR